MDILVGTQMVAKGHDFQNVGLVLVLNPDAQILSPSMRAREQLFATLMQVAGRAGRTGERGRVMIQTRFPEDPLLPLLRIRIMWNSQRMLSESAERVRAYPLFVRRF